MSENCEGSGNAQTSTPGLMANPQLNQCPSPETLPPRNGKAVVVGLYGVPGSGKTFLMNQLKQEVGQKDFAFYEGSETIAAVVPGGLEVFHAMEEQEKFKWRQCAIDAIGKSCADSGKVAVVVGHFMFWFDEQEVGQPVYTQNDLDTFTHILYLDVPAEVVVQRLLNDTERRRPSTSVAHLRKWQQAEKTDLRPLCRHHGILFMVLSQHLTFPSKVSMLLRDFWHHTEKYNQIQAETKLEEAVAGQDQLQTVLVLDADRTLAAEDAGPLFWERVSYLRQLVGEGDQLKAIFSSHMGYSYTAFRQATLLYEEAADNQDFDALCEDVASAIVVYPEWISLLKLVAEQDHVGAVVVTCGLRCIWDKVLEREGLSETVKAIGGGRIADGFIVSAALKGALVARLRDVYQTYVWAFGDSPLDIDMLSKADQATVVVGKESTRSKTMDTALKNAIDNDGLVARQAVLPSNASPRLDTAKLPLVQLTEQEFVDSVLCRRCRLPGLQVVHATDENAAKLLMTPTRDAALAGPALREAHRQVGWYLATEFLADVIGLEKYPISHVQGHHTDGYRLFQEPQTLIVALMRGGEAIASGVNDAFPLAMFVHANNPEDISLHHLEGRSTLVLVDSVVNSGKTLVHFVRHIRKLNAIIRIVVVTGVAQAQFVSGATVGQALDHAAKVSLIALRLSDNKFTGRGTTDTGNRLFNTTHLS